MLTLLTATGARPLAWSICERLMLAQDYQGPVRWIIVDDGEEAQPITFSREGWTLEIVRPTPFWSPGQNTQTRNMLAGLDLVGVDDRLFIIEDDDHYAAPWLSTANAMLDKAELVGETNARYYNLPNSKARQLTNRQHSSLCSTAMRGSAIASFRIACETGDRFVDMILWRSHGSKYLFDGNQVVGLKGLPGRGGIGMGHDPGFIGTSDPTRAILREWVGDDFRLYP